MSLVLNGTTGIVSANIQDGTITGSDIATNTIVKTNLNFLTGKVLQVVSSKTTSVITCSTIPWDDTIPQNTEGTEILTVSITPISATSTIYLKFDSSGSASSAVTNSATVAFFKDSSANAIYATQVPFWSASNYGCKFSGAYYELSGSTTARTYKVRVGSDGPTVYINANFNGTRRYGGVSAAIFEAWEIEA